VSKKILIPVNFDAKTVKILERLSESMITNKSAIIRTIIDTSLAHPSENFPEVLRNQIEKINKEIENEL